MPWWLTQVHFLSQVPGSLPESNVFIEGFDCLIFAEMGLRNPTVDSVADDNDFAGLGPSKWPPDGAYC